MKLLYDYGSGKQCGGGGGGGGESALPFVTQLNSTHRGERTSADMSPQAAKVVWFGNIVLGRGHQPEVDTTSNGSTAETGATSYPSGTRVGLASEFFQVFLAIFTPGSSAAGAAAAKTAACLLRH